MALSGKRQTSTLNERKDASFFHTVEEGGVFLLVELTLVTYFVRIVAPWSFVVTVRFGKSTSDFAEM